MSALGAVGPVLAWPSGSGVAGGALLALVLGVPGYLHSQAVRLRLHRAAASLAERHHAERLAQATAHHDEDKHLAERRHQRVLDALAASAPVAAEPVPPAAARPRTRRGGTL